MLRIVVPARELWNEVTQEFVYFQGQELTLEHSLVSISKWESKYKKPYLSKDKKTEEELRDYIRCMTINKDVKPFTYESLSNDNWTSVKNYIESTESATKFREDKNHAHNSEIITSELIYYWLVAYQIPFSCEKWNINRLLTLIRICNIKNQPSKKRSKNDIVRDAAALNAERKRKYNTTG